MRDSDLSGDPARLAGLASLCVPLGMIISHRRSPPRLPWLAFQTCCPRRPRRSVERMLAVVQPAPSGLHLAKRGSACLRFAKYRGSLSVVHFRYGPSVHLPQHPTPPRGDAVEVVFRREQPNSAGGTRTHVQTSFPGATFAVFGGMALLAPAGYRYPRSQTGASWGLHRSTSDHRSEVLR